MLYLITGMHRSGTSAVAGALSKMGVYLGDTLMPANAYNKKGYFEDLRIVRLNDMILKSHNASWDNPKQITTFNLQESEIAQNIIKSLQRPLWSMKDPRFCLTLKAWWKELKLYEKEIKVIACFRKAEAIAKSLKNRDKFTETQSYELIKTYWFYLIKTLMELNINPIIIQYERLVENPEKELSKTGLTPTKKAIKFIDKKLNHFS